MADGEGQKGGPGDKGGSGEDTTKAELERVKAENALLKGDSDKLKQDLEDLRLEVVSPEYLEFLNSKDKGDKGKLPDSKGDDDLSKLTPQQAYERAKKELKEEMDSKLDELKKSQEDDARTSTSKMVAEFARDNEDFETYRPIMYGLSLDPKNKDLSLAKLYERAKEHVKSIHTGPTDEEKAKSRRSSGEKPGGASDSFDMSKKYSPKEAADLAWDKAVGPSGLPV